MITWDLSQGCKDTSIYTNLSMRYTILTNWRIKPYENLSRCRKKNSQKDRQDEKAEGYVPDKVTRQNPRKTTKWSRDRQSSSKRIQNNDSEDDPGLGKRMEAKIEKIQEMFKKDIEELKNKQTDEQYNNWNENYTRRNQ